MTCAAGVGNSAAAFVIKGASTSAINIAKILKIISRILGNFSEFSASENENREFSLVLGKFREKNSRFELYLKLVTIMNGKYINFNFSYDLEQK